METKSGRRCCKQYEPWGKSSYKGYQQIVGLNQVVHRTPQIESDLCRGEGGKQRMCLFENGGQVVLCAPPFLDLRLCSVSACVPSWVWGFRSNRRSKDASNFCV